MSNSIVETRGLTVPVKRLLRMTEVQRMTGKCRATIYADVQRRAFPAPIKDGASSRWLNTEVLAWIDERIAERDKAVAA